MGLCGDFSPPKLKRGKWVEERIILADNQMIFRTGAARVLSLEQNVRLLTQCVTVAQLKDAIEREGPAIVIFPSSFAPNVMQILDWIEKAGGKAILLGQTGDEPKPYRRFPVKAKQS